MSAPPGTNNPLQKWIRISLDAQHPAILEGLDTLFNLGLLSEEQVRNICQNQLSCLLPQRVTTPPQPQRDFLEEPQEIIPRSTPRTQTPIPEKVRGLTQVWESLKAELSVRWLLFLGLFMVVVSSGVLAASQWQKVNPTGQYLILLAYTIAFWATCWWTGKNNRLPLTTETLRLVTLLLIPLNFWAIDKLGIWKNLIGILTAVIATFILTGITIFVYKTPQRLLKFPLINHLGLSYLHLGWSIPGFPLVAVYLGVIGTALISFIKNRFEPLDANRNQNASTQSIYLSPSHPIGSLMIGIYALMILLVRAIFAANIDPAEIGLALGISSLLFYQTSSIIFRRSAYFILALGWLVSVQTQPWQAFCVSGIGVWIFTQNLWQSWRRRDLGIIYAIGLEMVALVGRLIPPGFKKTAISTGVKLTQAENFAGSLLGVTWFPYLLFMLGVTDWLYGRQKIKLAKFSEWMGLGFGVFLMLISLPNPILRSLNLCLSTLTLATYTQRRQPFRVPLIYFTHITTLLAILSTINVFFKDLTLVNWAIILLVLMTLELEISTLIYRNQNAEALRTDSEFRENPTIWLSHRATFESAWYFGLGLATLSFCLLLVQINPAAQFWLCRDVICEGSILGGGVWLITPVALTIVAKQTNGERRQLAAILSAIACLLVQILTLGVPGLRLMSLGVATSLMIFNIRLLPTLEFAVTTVGFSLAFLAVLLWEGILGFRLSSPVDWFVAGAVTISTLWIVRTGIIQRRTPLRIFYAEAFDNWAIALTIIILYNFIVVATTVYQSSPVQQRMLWIIATILIMVATAYRSWQFWQDTPEQTRRNLIGILSVITLLVSPLPTLNLATERLITIGLATILMIINTRTLRSSRVAAISVGLGLLFFFLICGQGVFGIPPVTDEGWFIVGAIATLGLWLILTALFRQIQLGNSSILIQKYSKVIDKWATVLCTVTLIVLTLHSLGLYANLINQNTAAIISLGILSSGITYRGFFLQKQFIFNSQTDLFFNNWTIYALAWSIELLVAETLQAFNQSLLTLAIANTALGLLTQLLGDILKQRLQLNHLPNPWQIIPILYGILGMVLRWDTLTNWTGLNTLGFALILIGIGRRQRILTPLVYIGIAGVSFSTYELLFYHIESFSTSDQLVAFATLGTSLTYLYRILIPLISSYLGLPESQLKRIAHIHWGMSSLFLVMVTLDGFESGQFIGLGIGILLSRYAIMQGRHNPDLKAAELWVYLGLLEIVCVGSYLIKFFPFRYLFIPWRGAIVSLVAYFFYILPWETWGWSSIPWKRVALISPILTLVLTSFNLESAQILPWFISSIVALILYFVISRYSQNIRISYWGLALFVFSTYHFLNLIQLQDNALLAVTPTALSFLYIAQVEPQLKLPQYRSNRHYIRIIGASLICFAALFTTQWTGLLPGIISLFLVLIGLALRIRAFLYIGTATFLINAFNQLVILNAIYSFMKWVIGFVAGLLFMAVAANFETRREQIVTFLQNWVNELESWE